MENKTTYSYFWAGLLLLLLNPSAADAQMKLPFQHRVEVDILSSQLDKKDTSIVIRYSLKGSHKRLYNTQLYYSNNGGNSFKGPLRAITGDLGDSTGAGKNKSIAWAFRRDNPYFDGQRTMFKIEATEIPKIANGGPGNALKSLLIPGLGDSKVRNGYNYGWITALTYGCIGTGIAMEIRANHKYSDYKSRIAISPENHDNLLDQARRSQNIAGGFLIAGGVIWLADIIGVYGRGLKNRKRINQEKKQAEEEGESPSRGLKMVYPSMQQNAARLNLLWEF